MWGMDHESIGVRGWRPWFGGDRAVCVLACMRVRVRVCVSIPVKAEGWVLVVAMEMMDSGDI